MNVLITGGTSAVGRALVQILASQGHQLTFTYCHHDDAARQLCDQWSNVESCHVDFTLPDTVAKLVGRIPMLDIDVLVNNAYVGRPLGTHFHRTASAEFRQAFGANIEPTIQITQACISVMRRKKSGAIVTVGSLVTTGHTPAGYSVYAATKAYLQQLARSWHSEYSHLGIRSTTVLPDFMPTALHGDMLDILTEQELRHKPRLLTPTEVAQRIADSIAAPDLPILDQIIKVDE